MAWIGNHAMVVVLPFVVFESTGSPAATAVTVLGWAAPPVLVGQLAGVLADRCDRRRLLRGADAALAVLTLGYLTIDPRSWGWLAALTFVCSCVGQLVGPAEHALLPELASGNRWGEIAALGTLNNTLGRLVGPAAGSALFAATGLLGVVVLVSLCHAGAAVSITAIENRPPRRSGTPGPGLVLQWREGAAMAWREPVLRALLPLVVLMAIGEGFVAALLTPFIGEVLHAGPVVLGWILSAQAVGGIVGAWWCNRSLDQHDPLRLLALAALISGTLLTVLFGYPLVAPVVWPAVALTAVAGAPFAVVAAAQGLLLQRHSTSATRGRIYGLCWGLTSLVQIVAVLAAGLLAEHLGSIVIAVDAVAYLVVGVVGLLVLTGRRVCPERARDLGSPSLPSSTTSGSRAAATSDSTSSPDHG